VSTATVARTAGPSVGIGEIAASADPALVISALGLGSCIGLVMVDHPARVAGMAHVMLPQSRAGATGPPGKFADTAVPALVESLLRLGADRSRLLATIAGGAQMFSAGAGGGLLNVGERNDAAVRAALRAARLRLRAADVGGSAGRTMQVRVDTGTVTVRVVGGRPVEV